MVRAPGPSAVRNQSGRSRGAPHIPPPRRSYKHSTEHLLWDRKRCRNLAGTHKPRWLPGFLGMPWEAHISPTGSRGAIRGSLPLIPPARLCWGDFALLDLTSHQSASATRNHPFSRNTPLSKQTDRTQAVFVLRGNGYSLIYLGRGQLK